jgi:hypothetical protein
VEHAAVFVVPAGPFAYVFVTSTLSVILVLVTVLGL